MRYLDSRYVLDRVLAGISLILLSPLLGCVAVAVLTSSGRPILFRQTRVGRDGVEFEIIKFRTMVKDAETLGGGYMPEGMNLVTPVGSFLRRTSLDELPQLLNIVRGEMAFIGPRPALPDQYRRYTPLQRRRVAALPGITGLAQVTYRNNAPWSKRIELDLEYLAKVGLVMDLNIAWRTFVRTFGGDDILEGQAASDVDDL
ncbi:sugar transferase [Aeromicrobium phragmitis]|nr:sugar transferase [Aeromicrobium phragmitis]